MSFLPPLPPTFDAALRDATSRDPKFRLAAAERLADAPDGRERDAQEALRTLLDDRLGPVRAAAAFSLGVVGDECWVDVLRARFDDEHVEVRQASVRAAAALDTGGEWLRDLATSEHAELRCEALLAIAEHQPESARDVLRNALEDANARNRAVACRSLGALGASGVEESLALRLKDDDPEVIREAALALASFGDARGQSVLIKALNEPVWALDAAEGLGRVDTEKGREALAEYCGRTLAPLLVRAAAGASLARLGDARGEDALARVLRAWRADGRDYAVHAVGELRLSRLLPTLSHLAKRLRGADPKVLARALQSLSEHTEARVALEHLRERFGSLEEDALREDTLNELVIGDRDERREPAVDSVLSRGARPERKARPTPSLNEEAS